LYNSQGKYEEAEPLHLQALELRQRLLGENHPDVATSLNNLALLYNSQGRYEKAELLYLQALSIAEVSLGKEHPNTKTLRNNLQIMRQQQHPTSLTWWQLVIVILLTPFYWLWMLMRWLVRRFIR
jgi:tetratricopeptide (TPR) repeat protein